MVKIGSDFINVVVVVLGLLAWKAACRESAGPRASVLFPLLLPIAHPFLDRMNCTTFLCSPDGEIYDQCKGPFKNEKYKSRF